MGRQRWDVEGKLVTSMICAFSVMGAEGLQQRHLMVVFFLLAHYTGQHAERG